MEEKNSTNNLIDNGTQSKLILDKYHCVQFSLNHREPVYLFKLRNIRLNEPSILVKEDSTVLKKHKVGDILDKEYNPPGLSGHLNFYESGSHRKVLMTVLQGILSSVYPSSKRKINGCECQDINRLISIKL